MMIIANIPNPENLQVLIYILINDNFSCLDIITLLVGEPKMGYQDVEFLPS